MCEITTYNTVKCAGCSSQLYPRVKRVKCKVKLLKGEDAKCEKKYLWEEPNKKLIAETEKECRTCKEKRDLAKLTAGVKDLAMTDKGEE